MAKDVEIGSLKVRTIGSGANKVRVVLLPGHEFGIEHFLPENLRVEDKRGRVTKVTSLGGSKFLSFFRRSSTFFSKTSSLYPFLLPLSELRLARYLNKLQLPGLRAEEPLAALLHADGSCSVLYREVKGKQLTTFGNHDNFLRLRALARQLGDKGVTAGDISSGNVFRDKRGNLSVIDLEFWRVREKLKKQLKLTK